MRVSTSIAASALVAGVSAKNYLGFNSGATMDDNSAKFKADFKAEFETAQNLKNAPGDFNAVRLYTNIQAYSTNTPIEAFEAAIETSTYLLLGIWTSGTDNIDNEIAALKTAVSQYGKDLTDLVIGVSIGSEDLYRNSVTGVKNGGGVGANPSVIVDFINDFKKSFADTDLADVSIGHVDTWDAWTNSSNSAVIDAVDWLGVDEYPYYETGKGNTVDNAGSLFDAAYDATIGVAGNKPVWVTETGWPYTGPDWDEAVPSIANAKKYWDEIGCKRLFNQVPTFWYTLRDSNPDNTMKFAITNDLSTTPLFDLTCPKETTTSKAATSTKTSDSKSSKTADANTTGASKPTGSSAATATGSVSSSATPTGSSSSDDSSSSGSSSSSSSSAASTPSHVSTSGASVFQMGPVAAIAAMVAAFVL